MIKDRYELCKRFIAEGRWEIDLENGIVTGKFGSKGTPDGSGYLQVGVSYNSKCYIFKVHEIIAIAGGLDITNTTVDHINCNKQDNRLCNLQLLSRESNISKAHLGKEGSKGSVNGYSRLTEEQVAEIKMMLIDGRLSQTCIAWLYDVSISAISAIKHNRLWKHVEVLDYV